MSSKIKKWNFGKLFISNGAGCSGCNKTNLADIIIEPKSKIPNHTNTSPNICHTSSSSCKINSHIHFMDDDDFDQDDQTSTTFSIDIGSLSPPSSYQNDYINLSHVSEANSEFKVSTCPEIGDTFVVINNLDDTFQDNHTSTPFSIINIDSLSPSSLDKNDVTNLSQSETNSESKVISTCPKIGDTLGIVKNLDDTFQNNYHTSTPRNSDQNECSNISKANSEFRVDSCPKISNSLAHVINSDDPFQDFKKSMIHMIIEKEIYSFEDLEKLLNCFLKLNSPSNHYIIIQAFMEILNINNGKVVSEGPAKKN